MLRIEEIVGAMDDEFRHALDALDDAALLALKDDKAKLRRMRPVGVSHAEALAMIEAILARRAQPKPKPKRAPRKKKVAAAPAPVPEPEPEPEPEPIPVPPPPQAALPAPPPVLLLAPPPAPEPELPQIFRPAAPSRLPLAMAGALLVAIILLAAL